MPSGSCVVTRSSLASSSSGVYFITPLREESGLAAKSCSAGSAGVQYSWTWSSSEWAHPSAQTPLMMNRTVAYRLDLGTPRHDSRRENGAVALVVADPASRRPGVGRLPSAREEGESVTTALRAQGFDVTLLAAEQAVHADVLEALVRAEWLHYAGHGFSATGWDSALPLAGEAELDARGIVALPRVPEIREYFERIR